MKAGYNVKQIPLIVTDAYEDIMGKSDSITSIDTTDIVSLGKELDTFKLLDGWYGALTKRIVQTVVFARRYSADTRRILRDEHSWGAFVQKLYIFAPDAVDNPAFGIPQVADGVKTYHQPSPYDVETPLTVQSLIYGGEGTWSYEFIVPHEQLKEAFLSAEAMNAFIDGQFIAVTNKIEVTKESLINAAANTCLADQIAHGRMRNLLVEWNTLMTDDLTAAEALMSKDFLKWASKEINKTVKFIKKPSVNFNIKGYETHTPGDKLITEVLTEFAQACEYYLESDTYHRNLVSLPNYSEVPFWQYQGKSQSFEDCSSISVKNDDINSHDEISHDGIIAVLRDEESVSAKFSFERQWAVPNERANVSIYGYQYNKGFAVDEFANCIVFCIADNGTITNSTTDAHITGVTFSPNYVSAGIPITITPVAADDYHVKKVTVDGKEVKSSDDGYVFVPNDNEGITVIVTSEADS